MKPPKVKESVKLAGVAITDINRQDHLCDGMVTLHVQSAKINFTYDYKFEKSHVSDAVSNAELALLKELEAFSVATKNLKLAF